MEINVLNWGICDTCWNCQHLRSEFVIVLETLCRARANSLNNQTTICLNIDDGGKILSARQIRDPDTNIPSTVPGLRAFTCSRGFRRDLEKGMISPPVVVMRAPERVHSQKGHQGQWI